MYLGLAWHFWSTRWRRRPAGAAPGLRAWERGAILVPLALHGWLLGHGLFAAPQLRFGFAQALSVMMFFGVALYWIESLFYSLDGMEPLVLPLAALVFVAVRALMMRKLLGTTGDSAGALVEILEAAVLVLAV